MDSKRYSPRSRPVPPATNHESVRVVVTGRVQGVGYRFFAEESATRLGLAGWVRNLPDGTVEAEAEGPKPALQDWIESLKRGPSFARIDNMKVTWNPAKALYKNFEIR